MSGAREALPSDERDARPAEAALAPAHGATAVRDLGEEDRQSREEAEDRRQEKWRSRNPALGRLQDWFWPRPTRPTPPEQAPLSKTQIRAELADQTLSQKEAEALLDEARAIYETRDARLARIEARATTLQATVGIATALMLAAASVVLDSNKVAEGWRDVLAVVLVCLIACLVLSGWHATRATLKQFERDRLRSRDAVERPRHTDGYCEQQKSRAIDLLAAANENAYIDFRRTALLAAARRWFFGALALILGVAVLFGVYSLFGDLPAASR
jgi:hypothetical protein